MSGCLTTQTPVGLIGIYGSKSITKIDWVTRRSNSKLPALRKAQNQITAYFKGNLLQFDLCLEPSGSLFQKRVWANICSIPYGQTLTYGDLAESLASSPRAVGKACASNPIPLLIPCHRIIAKTGALTGYSGGGGIRTKELLLTLEQKTSSRFA